jgi:hypothetical protein
MMWIHAIWIGLVLAVLFELLTVALRFGLGWRSPDRTRPLGRLTRGWRVHHGYPGLLMMPAALPVGVLNPGGEAGLLSLATLGPVLLALGIMLAVSDLIHHAIVLPRYAGSHEFELHYPGHPRHRPAPVTREARPFPLRRAA